MKWYGVHVLMAVRFKDGNQTTFPAWENIYLVNAKDADEAEARGKVFGKLNEGDSSGTFSWNDRPAVWVYVGVRKVVEISNASSTNNDPADGVEVTYNTLEFRNEDALRQYVAGASTEVTVVD